MRRVLVTGATGFVGRQVMAALATGKLEVHGMARHPLASNEAPPAFAWHYVDLLQPGKAEAVIARLRPSHILHLAWCVDHGRFWTDPANLDWLAASCRLLRAFAAAGGQRFVGTGTCVEYASQSEPCDEHTTLLQPESLYAAAKHAFHGALRAFAECVDINYAWARLFFLIGPYENSQRVVPDVVLHLLRGESVSCGSSQRDFIDVRDAGEALASLLTSSVRGPVNIASGVSSSISQVAQRLGEIAGSPHLIQVGTRSNRPHDPPVLTAAVDRLRREVGFIPKHGIDDMLCDAFEWWRSRQPLPATQA